MGKKAIKLPKGTGAYVYVSRPAKLSGKYECTIRYSKASDVAEFVELARQMATEEFGAKKAEKAKLPFRVDESTNEVVFKCSSKYVPKVYNAKGQLIPHKNIPAINSGSTVRAFVKLETYAAKNAGQANGVTARFEALQLIKLVEGVKFEADIEDEDAYVGLGIENESVDDASEEEEFGPKEESPKGKSAATDF